MSLDDKIRETRWAIELMFGDAKHPDQLVNLTRFYELKDQLTKLEAQKREESLN